MMKSAIPEEELLDVETWNDPGISTFWVIVGEEKVGLVALEPHTRPAANYNEASPKEKGSLYLLMICLLPNHQDKGLGSLIMSWLKFVLRSSNGEFVRIVSNFRPSNFQSVNFHIKNGFKIVENIVEYSPDNGETALVAEWQK